MQTDCALARLNLSTLLLAVTALPVSASYGCSCFFRARPLLPRIYQQRRSNFRILEVTKKCTSALRKLTRKDRIGAVVSQYFKPCRSHYRLRRGLKAFFAKLGFWEDTELHAKFNRNACLVLVRKMRAIEYLRDRPRVRLENPKDTSLVADVLFTCFVFDKALNECKVTVDTFGARLYYPDDKTSPTRLTGRHLHLLREAVMRTADRFVKKLSVPGVRLNPI